MLRVIFLQVAVFFITLSETVIATWEGRADRQSTTAKTNKYSLRASGWAGLFELVLCVDMYVVAHEGWSLIPSIVLGGTLGKYWAVERRRKRFRRRPRRLKPAYSCPRCQASEHAKEHESVPGTHGVGSPSQVPE